MRVTITADKAIALVDSTDFKRFDVAAHIPRTTLAELNILLNSVADVDDTECAWIYADWIVQQSADVTADWFRSFETMVVYARKHGWVRESPLRIRGHIIWRE